MHIKLLKEMLATASTGDGGGATGDNRRPNGNAENAEADAAGRHVGPANVLALNMLFQFLFQELKDTKAVRRYIIRKMTLEFKELLNSKTAGKLIQRISVRFTYFV